MNQKDYKEIARIIKDLNLPFRAHMFILGNYSDLMGLEYE